MEGKLGNFYRDIEYVIHRLDLDIDPLNNTTLASHLTQPCLDGNIAENHVLEFLQSSLTHRDHVVPNLQVSQLPHGQKGAA